MDQAIALMLLGRGKAKVCTHTQNLLKIGSVHCRTYRLSQNVKPLIWVECKVEKHSRSRTEYLVKARSQFKERSAATNVEILLPLPADAITPTVRASQVLPYVLQIPWPCGLQHMHGNCPRIDSVGEL